MKPLKPVRKKSLVGYKSMVQEKNVAWFLPRPKKDHYKGGMPLYCEEWLLELAKNILEKKEVKLLQVFSGCNKYGDTIDINPVGAKWMLDVHDLSHIYGKKYDVIIADPPYSDKESKQLYNTPPLNYKKWTFECDKLLKIGGLLIVYHKYIMPNPNPEKYKVVKRVFIGNRTYHLPRVAIYFKKIQEIPTKESSK